VTQEFARRDVRLAEVETSLVNQQARIDQLADEVQATEEKLVTLETQLSTELSQVQEGLPAWKPTWTA